MYKLVLRVKNRTADSRRCLHPDGGRLLQRSHPKIMECNFVQLNARRKSKSPNFSEENQASANANRGSQPASHLHHKRENSTFGGDEPLNSLIW